MIQPGIIALATAIHDACGGFPCGQIVLNFNNGDLASMETRTHDRVESERRKCVDRRQELAQNLTR